jgi:serine protease AprX
MKLSETSSEEVQVILNDDVSKNDLAKVADDIAKAVNVHAEQIKFEFGSGGLQIPTESSRNVARIDAVKYITRDPKPRLLNNEARKILISNPSTNVSQYKGDGEIVSVADTGFDTGDRNHSHAVFQSRVG